MILSELLNGLLRLIYGIIYKLFSSVCVLIDFIKNIFHKLCGIEPVNIEDAKSDLLSNLLESKTIKQVFLLILLIGIILLVIFTIISIIRSNYDTKLNWKKVLIKMGQSFLVMIIIPFILIAGITLTNTIMSSINLSMQSVLKTKDLTIGGQFLVTMGSNSYIGPLSSRSDIESLFVSGELSYDSLSTVTTYYDITKLNYLIGLVGGVVILVMFVFAALTFVQRIFDIVLLYILSPVVISTMPLDDGNRLKVWKDLLISKILSAYGVIIVMNLFFMIIPQIYSIGFFTNNFENGVVHILFLIGGSFAVTKASRVISQLTGAQQTGGELGQMIYSIKTGIAFSKASSALVGRAIGRMIGGSDYRKMRKQGTGMMESFQHSFTNNSGRRIVKESLKKNKAKQIVGAPFRFASMPIGVLRDFAKGGIVRTGKNFVPRLKNIVTGSGFINRAENIIKDKTQDKE